MKKQILAVVLGTVVLFIWSAISWMALPFHTQQLNPLPESAASAMMQESVTMESNIYHYPGLEDPDLEQKVTEGPRIPLMVYVAEGTSLFDPMDFLKSLLFNLVTALLILMVLMRLSDPSTRNALSTSLVLALLVGFAGELPQTSWFMFPIEYAIVNMVDYLVGFLLAGWLMSKVALKAS